MNKMSNKGDFGPLFFRKFNKGYNEGETKLKGDV